jgi:hypothetical protein
MGRAATLKNIGLIITILGFKSPGSLKERPEK